MFIAGLDLGQSHDPSALVIVERVQSQPVETWEWVKGRNGQPTPKVLPPPPAVYRVRHAERWQLGTSYPAIVGAVKARCDSLRLKGGCQLVIDRTGVGRAVYDMFTAASQRAVGVSIHGGDTVSTEYAMGHASYRAPKRDLVGIVTTLLQARPQRLLIAQEMPLADVLVVEMKNFRMTINPTTAHDSYAAWRENDHDDILLALAVALWYGERQGAITGGQTNYWHSEVRGSN